MFGGGSGGEGQGGPLLAFKISDDLSDLPHQCRGFTAAVAETTKTFSTSVSPWLLGETERMMPLGIKFQLQCIDSRFYSILLHLCFMSFKMATISAWIILLSWVSWWHNSASMDFSRLGILVGEFFTQNCPWAQAEWPSRFRGQEREANINKPKKWVPDGSSWMSWCW